MIRGKEKDVLVVSIGDYSFKVLLEEKFYAFPKGSRRIVKYIAFYKNGKVEYYGEVDKLVEGNKKDIGLDYWIYCMPDHEPPFEIVKFKKIIKLKNELTKDNFRGGHIQGKKYTTIKKLLNSSKISEL
jgi:hypothetical protein